MMKMAELPTMTVAMVLVAILQLWLLAEVAGKQLNYDMESSRVCAQPEPVQVKETDLVVIYADPPKVGPPTRDRCTIFFSGENGTPFKFNIRELVYGECQVFVKVYEGSTQLNTPKFQFGCHDKEGGPYYTSGSEIAVSLEKPDAASRNYKFSIRMALVNGPDVGGSGGVGAASQDGGGLTTGTIVGIVIAAVLFLVVAIGVTIYLVMYRNKKKEAKYTADTLSSMFASNAKLASSHGDGSVHSSHHSTHITHATNQENPTYRYPAYRTAGSVMDKKACQSIDSKSHDGTEKVDGRFVNEKEKYSRGQSGRSGMGRSGHTKDASQELDGMKRALERHEDRKAREEAEERQRERERRSVSKHQAQNRRQQPAGKGGGSLVRQSSRDRPALTAENIRSSLRGSRDRSKSHDYDDRSKRSPRASSNRSHGSRSRNYSPSKSGTSYGYRDDSDSDSRGRRDHRHASPKRSSSSRSKGRRTRDRYDDRDTYSDYDDRDRHRGHRDHRDKHRDDRYDDRRNRGYESQDSQRSGVRRTKSSSSRHR